MQHPIKALAIVAAGALTLQGCTLSKMIKLAKQQQLTITPSPLELHGDSVKFEASVVVPKKMLKKTYNYAASPTYNYTDQHLPVGEVKFKGSEFPESKTRESKLTKTFGFVYAGSAMDRGYLTIKGTASNINGRSKNTGELPTGVKGLILTSRLVQEVYVPAYVAHGYIAGQEFAPTSIEFFFEQGSSKLRVIETESNRGKFLDQFLQQKNETSSVVITGMHSPEGREVKNVALSEERAKAIESFFRTRLKKVDYKKEANKIEFVTKSLVETWDPLKDTLAYNTDLTEEQKAAVLKVIDDSKGSFLETEAELEKLEFYPVLLEKVYPKLRTADLEIITRLPKKEDSQITMLAKQITEGKAKANALTDKELAYAATMTPILGEREAIYKAATKKRDDWASHNNLGAVYLEQARKAAPADRKNLAEKAITNLQISKTKQNSAEVNMNLATAYLLKGDYNNADLALKAANAATPNLETQKVVNSLAGSLLIRKGKYEEAHKLLNNAVVTDASVLFDRGLAQLLLRQYDAALASFNEATKIDPSYALAYYGSAIAFARKADESSLAMMLSKAVQLDTNLKAKAVLDLEFDNFKDKPAFMNAVR